MQVKILRNSALRIFPISHPTIVSNTADFLNLVLNIWKIFNMNVPKKDIRLKGEFSKILEFNDSLFPFLSRVVDWLECWSRGKENCQHKRSPLLNILVLHFQVSLIISLSIYS